MDFSWNWNFGNWLKDNGYDTNHDLKWISDTFFGTNYIGNEANLDFQQKANAQNEALMRESWQREDNAVQRRVADLKAAGLSPTLAAGSAAASSGPIRVSPLQSNPGISGSASQALSLISAKKSLEHMQLQNDLLIKQIENYGKPDWMVALNEIFGADKFSALLRGLGDKFYDMLFPSDEGSSGNNDYGGVIPLPSWESSFGFKGTSPSGNLPYPTKEQYQKVVESIGEHGTITKDNTVVFNSVYDARQWFLDIGGTTAEWYYGIRKYGSPENFIEHITSTGEYYFE